MALPRKVLEQSHPDYDVELLLDYRALYAGGRTFKKRVARFLTKNDVEPDAIYARRCSEAHYRPYTGTIINQFASMLVATPLEIRAKDESGNVIDADPFYATLKEDCDGAGTDLIAFTRKQVIEALTCRRAWWRVELPLTGEEPPADRAEWEARGLGRARLVAVPAEEVRDWTCDEAGNLLEVLTYCVQRTRSSMRNARGVTVHEWRIYDAQFVAAFRCEVADGQPLPEDIPEVSISKHGFSRVPFVCLDVGEELWLADRISSAQIEHFRLSNALAWSIRRTCYAMPVFKMKSDANGQATAPTMGVGYYLIIGTDEAFEWPAPPSDPFAVIRDEVAAQKDELYRVAQQLAQGVNNNAAAVGRSADSKLADADATRVVLEALGEIAREAIERTYDVVGNGRADCHKWSISGLGGADVVDPEALVATATDATLADIPSPTFQREFKTRVALALTPAVDQATKDKIRDEIHANIPDELPKPVATKPQDDEDDVDEQDSLDDDVDEP